MWATILEKAWSKVKGSIDLGGSGGFLENSNRALLGSP